jgi:hypothetical protein
LLIALPTSSATPSTLEVSGTIFTLGRPDGNEHDVGCLNGSRQIGREAEALFRVVAPDHFLEAGLVDGHLAALQRGDLRLILVDANHVVPVLGEAGPHDETDISSSDYGDFHSTVLQRGHATPLTPTRSRSRNEKCPSGSVETTRRRCRLGAAAGVNAEHTTRY